MQQRSWTRAGLAVGVMTSAAFGKVATKVVDFTPYGHAVTLTVPADWSITPIFGPDLQAPLPPQPILNPSVDAPKKRVTVTVLRGDDHETLDDGKQFAASMRDDVSFTRAEKTRYGWIVIVSDAPTCTVLKREFHLVVYNASLQEICADETPCRSLDEITPLVAICESMTAANTPK
jgi:hypothetical protein